MKKKESNSEAGQEIYVFQTPEEDRSHISTPNKLILKPKPPAIRHSKFEESMHDNLKKRSSLGAYDPHLLKQNPISKGVGDGEGADLHQYQPSNVDIDICKTPAELAELNKMCEQIFIADDLDFELDLQQQSAPKIEKEVPQAQNIFAKKESNPPQECEATPNQTEETKVTQAADQRILWERPSDDLANRQSGHTVPSKKQIEQPEKLSPKISGLTIYRNLGNVTVEITNKITLLLSPIPPGIILTCKLKRSRDLMNLLTPEYDFFLEKGLKHIVSAQKKILSNSEAFLVSTEIGNYDKSKIVASLRSNVLHNDFLIMGKEQGKDVKFKFIYGSVNYGKLNKDKTQRNMSVTVPVKVSVGVRTDHIRSFTFDSLSKEQQLTLHRRRSQGEKSEKNFDLVDEEVFQDDYNYLRLVKQSENVFNIEVQHPLSPLQAFGVVLTRFDAQLR